MMTDQDPWGAPGPWAQVVSAVGTDEHLELCGAALLEIQQVEQDRTTRRILGMLKREDGLLTPAGAAKVNEMLRTLESPRT